MYIFNSKKRLAVKVLCFLVLLGMTLCIVNKCYLSKNHYDSNGVVCFKEIEPGIVVSNTGSSHGLYGFNYNDLKNKWNCFNFALTSQSISYDYEIVSYYSDYLAEGGIMFITVSFFSFYGREETDNDNFESKNKRYYSILPPHKIKKYDWKEDIKNHLLPVINDEDLLRILVEGKETGEENWKKIWYLNAAESEDLEEAAERAYQRHYVDNENIIETKKVREGELKALRDIILLCKEKNVEPVLITTPLLPEYKDKIRKDFLEDFYKRIGKIAMETGVEYYDYSSDMRFIHSPALFMDVDHLNEKGALKFTGILEEEIIRKRLLY